MEIDLEVFTLIYLTIGLSFFFALWICCDFRHKKLYEAEYKRVPFYCIKCKTLFSKIGGLQVASCPKCAFKNTKLEF
jgi:DNA-directed RNA polymerase subunit RPC12/RpoP